MDMSTTERVKALSHADPGATSRAGGSVALGRLAVNASCLGALSFLLCGCSVLQPAPEVKATPPPPVQPTRGPDVAAASKPPAAPTKPPPPAPQPAKPPSQTRPLPATASRGAEKLAAPSPPAVARPSEPVATPRQPAAPQPLITTDPDSPSNIPVNALIVRGPPRQPHSRHAGLQALLWLALGLSVAASVVLARLYIIRRAKPAELPPANKEVELEMPPELIMREPINLPQAAIAAEEPRVF